MTNTIRMLSTLGLMGAMRSLSAAFETASGIHVDADFAPTLALLKRLRDGEAADLIILTREGLDEVIGEGRVIAESAADLARSFVGIAVRAGQPHPDIGNEAALRQTLLAARSVAYSRLGASGVYFAQLIVRMGIAAEINTKATIVEQGFTAERLVSGEADLAVQQISELKQVDGIEVVGPVPHELQTPAVFSAGRMVTAKQADAADRLLRYLASPEVVPVLRQSGLEP
jgi:molybdate transport system substrate-binding protein